MWAWTCTGIYTNSVGQNVLYTLSTLTRTCPAGRHPSDHRKLPPGTRKIPKGSSWGCRHQPVSGRGHLQSSRALWAVKGPRRLVADTSWDSSELGSPEDRQTAQQGDRTILRQGTKWLEVLGPARAEGPQKGRRVS